MSGPHLFLVTPMIISMKPHELKPIIEAGPHPLLSNGKLTTVIAGDAACCQGAFLCVVSQHLTVYQHVLL